MDFIRANIEKKIKLYESFQKLEALKVLYQARFEYMLIYALAYLWNKHIHDVESEDREFIFANILTPSIGQIVQVCRMLDIEKEVFNNKRVSNALDKYPYIRNEKIGHGYSFSDETREYLKMLDDLFHVLKNSEVSIFSKEIDFVLVVAKEKGVFSGIRFKSDGTTYLPWNCSESVHQFQLNNLYGLSEINHYFRLSPFIVLKDESEYYCYCSIQEKLLGQVKYNQLVKSGKYFHEWEELISLDIDNDSTKRKSSNGTIINIYENNYKKYIDIGIKNKIINFLTKNNASVCATIWGHGGVGKTATVQSVCEDLANSTHKKFDYIIFVSAKDRRYNFYTGEIEEITDNISTLEELIKNMNLIMFGESDDEEEKIFHSEGKVFLVIDDFETFSQEEKNKIREFILKLNINHHKVLITTRANIIIGQELPTNELNKQETKKFLLEVIKNELPNIFTEIERELEDENRIKLIHNITSGRPLFIFQLAFIIGQKGNIDEALRYDIKDSVAAKNFLYGRLYEDYLSDVAKDIFVAISLLVTAEDLSNLIDKIAYILNLEYDQDKFSTALKELVRLKVIKSDEDSKFFEVYSKEILQIMNNYFEKRRDAFKGNCKSRLNQINKNKSLNNEQALLMNANASRLSKNEEEVISNYRQILNRATSPEEIKVQAILSLAAYLVDRGNKHKALDLLNEFKHIFEENSFFNKMHATYYWGNGTNEQKRKAIKILLDFTSKKFDLLKDINLEIAGQLLTYRCIMLLNDWLDLNTKNRFKEITLEEYKQERKKQLQVCKDIFNKQGIRLFHHISQYKLDEMQSGVRQNVISGLYQFLDICLRLQKFEKGKDICEYMIYFAPRHFHAQFQRKIEKFNSIIYHDSEKKREKQRNKNKSHKDQETDLGTKLKEAFKEQKL